MLVDDVEKYMFLFMRPEYMTFHCSTNPNEQ